MGRKVTIDRSKVLDFIRTSDHPVTSKEIVQGTGYSGDAKYLMKAIVKEYPDKIQRIGERSRTAYIWNPVKALNSEMKNPEGYSDPTAGAAIRNTMKSDGKYHRGFKFGEVYSCKSATDDMEGILVISARVGTVIGLKVYPKQKYWMKDGYFVDWADEDRNHFASSTSFISIPEFNVGNKLCEIDPTEIPTLKGQINNAIDISMPIIDFNLSEPKEVIKEVEVVKEIKVPDQALLNENAELRNANKKLGDKIKELETRLAVDIFPELHPVEYHTDPAEIEAAVMKAKIEIYEKLIFGDSVLKAHKLQAV